jgi:uncharacterized membrane protein
MSGTMMADRDTNIAMLMGMGATIDQATEILDKNRGDIDLAMAQFCNAKISNKTSLQNIYSSLNTTGMSNEQYKTSSHTSRPRGHRRLEDDDADDALISPLRPSEKLGYSPGVKYVKGRDRASLEKEKMAKQDSSAATGATSLYAAQQRVASKKMDAYSTPSFRTMATKGKTAPSLILPSSDNGHHSDNMIETTNSYTYRKLPDPRPPARIYPGAVAVGTEQEEESVTPTVYSPSVVPLTAQIVTHQDEDYEALEDQLRKQQEELERVRAEREHMALAQATAARVLEERLQRQAEELQRQQDELQRVNAQRQNVAVAQVIQTGQEQADFSTLDGKIMVGFGIALSLAAVFSLIALVSCNFVKSDEILSFFTIGLVPTCNSGEFSGYLQNNAARKVSLAFAVLAFLLGAVEAIAMWIMICKCQSYKHIGFILVGLVITTTFQLLTLVVLNVCQLYGYACKLASGGMLSVTTASIWIICCTGIAIHSSISFGKQAMPHGKIILCPAVILSIAAVLSFTSLLTCSYVKGAGYNYSSRDTYYFELGVWPDCEYRTGYLPTYIYFASDESKRKISAAFGVIACFIGTGAAITVWVMTCKKYSTKYIFILCGVIFVTFVFQLVTLTMFRTESCIYGCSLSTGGKLSVSAAFLWFVSFVCLFVIFQPWMKINIPGKVEQQPSETAQQEPRNDVEETEAEIEIAPSANVEATVE